MSQQEILNHQLQQIVNTDSEYLEPKRHQQEELITQPQQETTQPSQAPSTNHEEEQEEPWSSITEAVNQANTLLSTGTFSVYH